MQIHAALVLMEILAQCLEELHVTSSETRLKTPTYQGTISKPKLHSAPLPSGKGWLGGVWKGGDVGSVDGVESPHAGGKSAIQEEEK